VEILSKSIDMHSVVHTNRICTAFTRTLTIIYSTTLLSLFTSIQLTLLARSKYVQSVLQQEQDERLREQLELGASVSAMLWGGIGNLLDMEHLAGENGDDEGISEQVEIKYLTLSWWILHAGWKDIAERVRRGVEEVFDGVSLRTKLGAMELHRLVGDVRRRVEHEVTFEGNERRIK
jgi:peroxin-3